MTMVETLVDILHVLRDVRRERNVYREIALCAIRRLHEQSVVITRQRTRIRRLCGELHDLRGRGHSHMRKVRSHDRIGPTRRQAGRMASNAASAPTPRDVLNAC
jgi:hypothetical protein